MRCFPKTNKNDNYTMSAVSFRCSI